MVATKQHRDATETAVKSNRSSRLWNFTFYTLVIFVFVLALLLFMVSSLSLWELVSCPECSRYHRNIGRKRNNKRITTFSNIIHILYLSFLTVCFHFENEKIQYWNLDSRGAILILMYSEINCQYFLCLNEKFKSKSCNRVYVFQF